MTTLLPTRFTGGLRRWFRSEDPFDALWDEMQDLITRFESDGNGRFPGDVRTPRADLCETDGDYRVTMDVPGLKPDEIDIEVQGKTLYVSAEHKEEHEEKGRTWHRTERRRGALSREVTLPAAVDEEKVSAECKNGVLTITLPKTEQARGRHVEVKA